ncbi:MAG: AsmA-like C-terminal region-containing protein [Owenweeksia sp.]|nr:AsmA-like C-terminal region-containing protein [Owenweeksia sp.]
MLNYIFFDEQKLLVDAKVKSQQLVMKDFLVSGAGSTEAYNLAFVNTLDLDLSLQVDRFLFHKFFAKNIKGELNVHDGLIEARSIVLYADEGQFNETFVLTRARLVTIILKANLNGTGANLHELFVSFGNFGQEVLLAENIFGKADLNLQMSSRLQPDLYIDPATVNLKAGLLITDGNLKNYEPMRALSDFAHLDELRDVRFDRLENEISIHNSKIHIPEMTVQSNVLDLTISGEHSFTNNIDYSMVLKLSEVLLSSGKRKIEAQNLIST